MKTFETIKVESKTTFITEGMSIKAFIAGVNSGEYGLPFVVQVSTWAKRWGMSKFFFRQMNLSIYEVKMLKDELDKVISSYEKEQIK